MPFRPTSTERCSWNRVGDVRGRSSLSFISPNRPPPPSSSSFVLAVRSRKRFGKRETPHSLPGSRVSCPGRPGWSAPNPPPDGSVWQKKPSGARSSHLMNSKTAIPCMLIRGGTSKGAYFLASDLPFSRRARCAALVDHGVSPSRSNRRDRRPVRLKKHPGANNRR
jgi:hypothetical protein